jgi:hypothetical protein
MYWRAEYALSSLHVWSTLFRSMSSDHAEYSTSTAAIGWTLFARRIVSALTLIRSSVSLVGHESNQRTRIVLYDIRVRKCLFIGATVNLMTHQYG